MKNGDRPTFCGFLFLVIVLILLMACWLGATLPGMNLSYLAPLALLGVVGRDLELEKLSYLMRQLTATSRLKILAVAWGCWVIVKFTAPFNWGGKL